MASKVGDLRIELSAETAAFRRDMEKARGDIRNASKSMSSDLAGVSSALGSIKTAMGSIAVTAAAGMFVSTVTEFERLNASLKTITGSSAGAEKAMGFLQDFAATTPYQLQEVVGAFTKLKAMGMDPSREALESYGNTASAMGKGLNQMIEAVADAATGEFERLKEFGIKAKSEGNNVSFTFQGVTTTVRKNSEEIQKYLIGIGNTKFAGAMADQMDSLSGQLSNLKDSTASLMVAIGNTGVVNLLADVAEFSSKAIQGWTFLGKHISNQMYALREFNKEQKKVFDSATPEQQGQMVSFDRRRQAAAATSAAIINGPTKIGTVMPEGTLASQVSAMSPGPTAADVKKNADQIKQIFAELAEENKAAITLNQEMYEQLGVGAENVAKDEVQALMERAAKWKEAGAEITDINTWLYEQIDGLRATWAEKGEQEAVDYLNKFSWHSQSLIDEYVKVQEAAVDELNKIGVRMDLLDKQDITLDVYLRDHASAQINAIIARVQSMQAYGLGVESSVSGGGSASSSSTTTINISEKVSRSDVSNIVSEASRQEDRS